MKKIESRGRTLDAVLHPKKYAPFSTIPDSATFEAAWATNPDSILANMAHAAYCDDEYLQELFKSFGASTIFYHSEPGKNGILRGRESFLAIWANRAILSFRGTEPDQAMEIEFGDKEKLSRIRLPFLPTDVIDDLAFLPTTYQGERGESQVHRGFFNATKELWPDISIDLEKLKLSDPDQVFVTGHSLGAAMAVMAGMMYTFNKIVTFGEPSGGNNLDNSIAPGSEHTRYVNGNDPVTKIVPKFLYRHHGIEKAIEDSDGPDIRYDHSIINYAVILESK